jgi:hypothetical protein
MPSRLLHLFPRSALVLALALAAAPARAETPLPPPSTGMGFFLSWGRPWGEPGARSARLPACRDTTAIDTLYLSFRTPVAIPRLLAFTADLYFHAAAGDSLGDYWFFEGGAANAGGLSVAYQRRDGEGEVGEPWRTRGVGIVSYSRTRASGKLRMAFAVDTLSAVPLAAGDHVTFARVFVRARHRALRGCAQPVAVEWRTGTLAFAAGQEYRLDRGGVRWAVSGREGLQALASVKLLDRRRARALLAEVEPAGPLRHE